MKASQAVFILAKFISPEFNKKDKLEKLLETVKDDWEEIIRQANISLLIPALYISLKNKNIYEKLEDKTLKEYLYEMYMLNRKRNIGILEQIKEINTTLKENNITPLLLKGAAALSENYFDDIGVRCMMDIDLAVDKDKIFEAVNILKSIGYEEIEPEQKLSIKWHHYRRLYKPSGAASVEIHRMVISSKAIRYIDFELSTKNTKIKNAKVMNITDELYYTFLHSEVAHNYHDYGISLRHLHHAAVLISKYKNEIDFEEVKRRVEKHKLEKTWNEYLWIIKKLFEIEIPVEIPQMVKYEQKVCKNIDSKGNFIWYMKKFVYVINVMFSFEGMQNKYENITHRYQMVYYVPYRMFEILYKIISDKQKRKNIKKVIWS